MAEKQRLFVDMDETLAVFTPVDELETLYEKGYFLNQAPHENVIEAVREIIDNNPDIEVNILSAYLTDSKYALQEKNEWLDRYLPEVDQSHRIFVPCGSDKKEGIKGGIRSDDFLLDDYTHNLNEWQPPARGIKLLNAINHTRGSWEHDRIRYNREPKDLANGIISIMRDERRVFDEKINTEREDFEMRKINENDIQKVSEEVYNFYKKIGKETDITEIHEKLSNGDVDEYVNDFINYRTSLTGIINTDDLIEVYRLVSNLNSIAGKDNTLYIPVAIENVDSKDGFRIIYEDYFGYIQPLSNSIFNDENEVAKEVEDIGQGGLKLVSYDELVQTNPNIPYFQNEILYLYNIYDKKMKSCELESKDSDFVEIRTKKFLILDSHIAKTDEGIVKLSRVLTPSREVYLIPSEQVRDVEYNPKFTADIQGEVEVSISLHKEQKIRLVSVNFDNIIGNDELTGRKIFETSQREVTAQELFDIYNKKQLNKGNVNNENKPDNVENINRGKSR